MTRDDVLKMEAGREMDALIAEKVIGWTRKYVSEHDTQVWDSPNESVYLENAIPHYSTDISAAWEVVEKMLEFEKDVAGHDQVIITRTDDCLKWYIEFRKPSWEYAEAEALPLAICRAALLALLEPHE